MKTKLVLLLLVFLSVSTYGQRKLKKTTILESGFDIKKEYVSIRNTMVVNGLNVTINPISADSLNSMFYSDQRLDGKFNYKYFEKRKKSYFLRRSKMMRRKGSVEFLNEGISWLFERDLINKEESDELERQVISHFDPKQAKEIYTVKDKSYFNPFWTGEKYLNVFEVMFENKTSEYKEFNEQILIQNKDNVLRPFTNTEPNTIDLSRRQLYLPITIPPNSTVRKFFACLPIDHTCESVTMHFPRLNSSMKWKINSDLKTFNDSYAFYEFVISSSFYGNNINEVLFTIIKTRSPDSLFILDETLFVEENSIEEVFEIFALAIYFDKIYYGRLSDLKALDYMDLKKRKRRVFELKLEKIDELKSKVKRQ